MSRWWRAYDEALDDEKLNFLSDKSFRGWFKLMCLASKNGGIIPPLKNVAFRLRITEQQASRLMDELCNAGLLDPIEVSDAPMSYEPHNWKVRQFQSDVSTERVKRFRNAKRNVSETASETPPETDTESEQNISCAVAKATRPKSGYDEKFEEAWQAYPRRDGANPKAPSAKLFLASVKAGADADEIIAGIKRYAEAEQKNIGTPFIPQMVKWLRDKRWLDYDGTIVPIKFDVRKHLV